MWNRGQRTITTCVIISAKIQNQMVLIPFYSMCPKKPIESAMTKNCCW